MLANGEVDFVVSGLPPLIGTPNIEWLGYLPEEINSWLVFSGGLGANAKEPEAGRALLKFLTSPAAAEVWKDNGLEPRAVARVRACGHFARILETPRPSV